MFFDQQFYQGVFERWSTDGYQVARVTFGTQNPSEPQIRLLIQDRWSTLQWTTASAVASSNWFASIVVRHDNVVNITFDSNRLEQCKC